MKIKDLLERSGVQLLSGGCGEEEITALTYDSRKAQTGSLTWAGAYSRNRNSS